MIRKLYDWVMRQAASPHAPWALAAVSFAESSFFPVPPDVMLAPMAAARPERAYRYALICTIASVLGGMLGYAIGFYAAPLGQKLLTLMGHSNSLAEFQALYAKVGLWIILVKGLTPIPYKLITIASGLAKFSFPVFVAASVVTRGSRFFLAAALLKRFGPSILPVVEKRLYLFAGLFVALLVGGFLAMKFL